MPLTDSTEYTAVVTPVDRYDQCYGYFSIVGHKKCNFLSARLQNPHINHEHYLKRFPERPMCHEI